MDLRAGFSDSNEISNNSSTSIVAAATANAETGLSHPLDILTHPEVAALRLLSNNLESVFDSPESFYSDAKLVLANGREVSVHRCLLSSRSSFFKSVFESAKENGGGGGEGESGDVKIDVKELANDFDVGFDSLVAVLAYVYCGRVMPHPKGVCECVDEVCSHAACRPVVDFMVEVLYLAFTFQIPELVALYQRYLLDLVDKVARDDVLVILSVADKCVQACKRLMDWCIETIVKSDVDIVTIEKTLSDYLVKQIIDSRIQLGLDTPESSNFPDKHVKRIFRALDSDDVELVNMLLKEGNTNLDDAHALHYAVAYCDAKITTELLDLALADVNARNSRGYTVLHVAAMRKEPKLIVSLLTKGARPSDLTLDGRKALQLAKRLTKAVDYNNSTEEGRLSPKDRLCIEILEQAERREPLVGEASLSLAMAGDDLRLRLLYLENRVALARLLFPMEAQVAMDIAQVNGTTELPLARLEPESLVKTKRTSMDLNAAPFKIQEEHLNRLKALSRTVELGKYFFPRCSEVLNGIMDAEDLSQLACIEKDTPEERLLKKRRYVELQEVLSKAFDKDKEELDKSVISSSSSSTSKSIGMVKPRKTIHKTR